MADTTELSENCRWEVELLVPAKCEVCGNGTYNLVGRTGPAVCGVHVCAYCDFADLICETCPDCKTVTCPAHREAHKTKLIHAMALDDVLNQKVANVLAGDYGG